VVGARVYPSSLGGDEGNIHRELDLSKHWADLSAAVNRVFCPERVRLVSWKISNFDWNASYPFNTREVSFR